MSIIMRPKLLIVDDEPGIVDMIRSYFQSEYDILTAYSGREALEKVSPANARYEEIGEILEAVKHIREARA